MTPGAVKLWESLQQSWRIYVVLNMKGVVFSEMLELGPVNAALFHETIPLAKLAFG